MMDFKEIEKDAFYLHRGKPVRIVSAYDGLNGGWRVEDPQNGDRFWIESTFYISRKLTASESKDLDRYTPALGDELLELAKKRAKETGRNIAEVWAELRNQVEEEISP